jgi:hypothetical protein
MKKGISDGLSWEITGFEGVFGLCEDKNARRRINKRT